MDNQTQRLERLRMRLSFEEVEDAILDYVRKHAHEGWKQGENHWTRIDTDLDDDGATITYERILTETNGSAKKT